MDYVVGSVAALISGNVTPNRPKLLRKALTPTKHPTSPNVTPKSELVDDRSIFLSPSLQKKKAIVKKSPKRIFENPDLDITNDGEVDSTLVSPKAVKVKKHLKDELEAENMPSINLKSPKKGKGKLDRSIESETPKKKTKEIDNDDSMVSTQSGNESTPKKKKKKTESMVLVTEDEKSDKENSVSTVKVKVEIIKSESPIKKRKSNSLQTAEITENNQVTPKKKKIKKSVSEEIKESTLISTNKNESELSGSTDNIEKSNRKKNKKLKKKKSKTLNSEELINQNTDEEINLNQNKSSKKNKKIKNVVNPNAISNQDTDSEHESDNDIESENEETNKEILHSQVEDASSDEEEEEVKISEKKEKQREERNSEEDLKRTIFVGNVPFSTRSKKEIKKIFIQYGPIESLRVRTVPVKDARVTPKLAAIKNELHPDRSTVNFYVKFKDAASVQKALSANNTVLNGHHLRVSRSDDSGEHDWRRAVFVGNLPFTIEDEGLRAKFEKCGEIESVRIVRDRKTNAGKGFGYVNFASKDGVELALSMTEEDLTIKNRILRVQRCTLSRKPEQAKSNERKNIRYSQGRDGFQSRGRDYQGRGGFQGRGRGGSQGRGGYQGRGRGNQGRGGFQGGRGFQGRGGYRERGGNVARNERQYFSEEGRPGQEEGAFRRIQKRKQFEESGGEPPNKTQPKEKKARQEFVGMTAEKKKKHKFDKGQKKKKVLSEILTK